MIADSTAIPDPAERMTAICGDAKCDERPAGVYRVCGASDAYLQAIAWAVRDESDVCVSNYCPRWAAERDRTRFPVGLPVIELPEPDSARPLFHPLTLVFAD